MEEFQEADVLWTAPEHHNHNHGHGCCHQSGRHSVEQPHPSAQRASTPHLSSAPVRIPVAADVRPRSRGPSWARTCCVDGVDGHDGVRTDPAAASGSSPAAIVPPHVLAARRCSEERVAAYSVCVGHGRTLKGRDLRAVRNAVLHMTGFLGGPHEY